MNELIEWLASVPGHVLVQLFDTGENFVVNTWVANGNGRRLLKRSAEMEAAIIKIVEEGQADPDWEGLLYIMGRGQLLTFAPLYIGMAERKGRKNALSPNFSRIRTNRHRFARWGDGTAFHIGDLSQVLFKWEADTTPKPKYERWAKALFSSCDTLQLKEQIYLYLAPWRAGQRGASGLSCSLPAAEDAVIALASVMPGNSLLNRHGT